MSEKRSVTNETKDRYRKASKKGKGAILDGFCELTGYNRSYAARKLMDAKTRATTQKMAGKHLPALPWGLLRPLWGCGG
jgi:hypothetical protein